jgi:hypothetical protein
MRRIAIFCAAATVAACSESASGPSFQQPEGCYDLLVGPWNGVADEVLLLPPAIELRAELGTDVLERDRRLVRPFPDTGNRSYRWSWWEPIEADSIRLIWSTGFTGIEMRLARRSDGYLGRAENFLDYPGNIAQAEASLGRRACT